jgi:hypothetical protein
VEVRDEAGKLYNDFTGRVKADNNGQIPAPAGQERVFVLSLDTAQYQLDVNRLVEEQGDDVYAGRGLHSFTSQLNLSRFGHTSLCLRLIDWAKILHPTYPTKCA